MIKSIRKKIQSFRNRNKIILMDYSRQADPKKVNLNWWKGPNKKQNVGDYISIFIVEKMKALKNVGEYSTSGKTKHLYAIGSIIDGGRQDATIWGSGIHHEKEKYPWRLYRKLDIRCVRGPETRRVLLENGYKCSDCYGDPALLMPLFYTPKTSEKVYEYLVIPHYTHKGCWKNTISTLTTDWESFIDEINKTKLVISSSLHGIILAEAYGIPAILLQHNLDCFKYEDYYYSTGRNVFPIAASVEEALQMEPAQLPDVCAMQKNLLNSFPYDLWLK